MKAMFRDQSWLTEARGKVLKVVLAKTYKLRVTPEDFVAYLAAVAASPAYTARFQANLSQPGLRIPMTARPNLFAQALEVGRRVVWLHTFGDAMSMKADQPTGPPRLPKERAPRIPKDGTIPDDADSMPDEIGYDESRNRLLVGNGLRRQRAGRGLAVRSLWQARLDAVVQLSQEGP